MTLPAHRLWCHCWKRSVKVQVSPLIWRIRFPPSGLIHASFALSPQFSRCFISAPAAPPRRSVPVTRHIFRTLTNLHGVAPQFFLAVFFSPPLWDWSISGTVWPCCPCYISSVRVRNSCRNVHVINAHFWNAFPCVSVAQHKWALKGWTRFALLLPSQWLQLASNRIIFPETASVGYAESR